MIAKIRGGDWQRLVPIAEELLSQPEMDKVQFDYYDDFTGGVGFFYKGVWVEVSPGYLRIADKKGLGFKRLAYWSRKEQALLIPRWELQAQDVEVPEVPVIQPGKGVVGTMHGGGVE